MVTYFARARASDRAVSLSNRSGPPLNDSETVADAPSVRRLVVALTTKGESTARAESRRAYSLRW
jgi:hypothetical protein